MQRLFGGMVGGFVATALIAVALVWAVTTRHETVQWIFENGLQVKNGSETVALTVTGTDSGNGMVVLPANSVGLGSEVSGVISRVIFCGELAENATTYLGPSTGALGGNGADLSIGSAACDALDNTTEGTADAPISTLAVKVLGMRCVTDGTLGASETLTFTLRTATADVVTTDGSASTLTCALAAGETECRTTAGTTTNIAAGATMAVKAVEVSNNADDNGWCEVTIAWP